MNYSEIEISFDETYFIYKEENFLKKTFLKVFAFHSNGIATVKDSSGWYHIDIKGNEIYQNRYALAYGYYFNLASVKKDFDFFHIDIFGKRIYTENYLWCGNFVEKFCAVKDKSNRYFHLQLNGEKLYKEKYFYVGDFYEGVSVVTFDDQTCNHINNKGELIHKKNFLDLGIYHKGFAIAKDEFGYFHIDKSGKEIYKNRYKQVEPFYNGISYAINFEKKKVFINYKTE